MKYLDHIDENAKSIGSINTIVNKNGKLFGLNTDYLGSIYTLKKMKIKKSKKNFNIWMWRCWKSLHCICYKLF